jgi:hypothetical protein
MRWRVVLSAITVAGALAWGGVAPTLAQGRDGCGDTRFGSSAGCMNDVREFNFSDPGIANYTWHQLRGRYIVTYYADMRVELIPVSDANASAAAAPRDAMSPRGEYQGNTPRELYCMVYARGC